MPAFDASEMFARPTSVFLSGGSRPLLNWVAYALTARHRSGLVWTDVRLDGETLDDDDLLGRDLLPKERLLTVSPGELARDELPGNVAVGDLVRSDERPEAVQRFADFLRLPRHTRDVISRLPREGSAVIVLSNGHRIVALYPTAKAGPTVRSIVEAGVSLLMTWADAPPAGRLAFEHILHVTGNEPAAWRKAVLHVERGGPAGPLRTGSDVRLGDWPAVTAVLSKAW